MQLIFFDVILVEYPIGDENTTGSLDETLFLGTKTRLWEKPRRVIRRGLGPLCDSYIHPLVE